MEQLSTVPQMLSRVLWLLSLSELRERVVEGYLATLYHGKRRDKWSQPIWNTKKADALEELEMIMKSQMEVQDLIEEDYLVIIRFT